MLLTLLLAGPIEAAVLRGSRLQQRRERLLLLDALRAGRGRWRPGDGELAGRISGLRPAAQVFRWAGVQSVSILCWCWTVGLC